MARSLMQHPIVPKVNELLEELHNAESRRVRRTVSTGFEIGGTLAKPLLVKTSAEQLHTFKIKKRHLPPPVISLEYTISRVTETGEMGFGPLYTLRLSGSYSDPNKRLLNALATGKRSCSLSRVFDGWMVSSPKGLNVIIYNNQRRSFIELNSATPEHLLHVLNYYLHQQR